LSRSHRLEVTYTVRRWDVISMYVGSWGARTSAAIGVGLAVMVIVSLPDGTLPIDEKIKLFGFGVALAVLGPLLLAWMLLSMYGTGRLVGKEVHLVIDDKGVRGWPVAPYQDRSWPRIRKVRRLGGVITLPFRQFGSRAGWVPIPARALTTQQLEELDALLVDNGLIKAPKPVRGSARPEG
jgi:hypothetical protein